MRSLALLASISLCTGVPAAQSTTGTFDVASVKVNRTADSATALGFQPGGRFVAVNEPLWRLIAEAYAAPLQLSRNRIVGGPTWLDTDRFDIIAVAQGTSDPSQQRT